MFLLKIVITESINLKELLLHLKKVPQTIKNVAVSNNVRKNFDKNKTLKTQIENVIKQYPNCRVVVRPSGTENVIRIMVEGGELNTQNIINKIELLLK